MQKKRARTIRKIGDEGYKGPLPFFMLACLLLLALQPRMLGVDGDLYSRILALQFPFLLSAAPAGTAAELPPPQVQPDIDEGVGDAFRVELMRVEKARDVSLVQGAPGILIYHTHTTEAYTQDPLSPYAESGEWRTEDNARNIVAVGERLAEILREQYGFNVIHDTTNHEPPKLSTSYSRSVITMENYKAQYPSISMFIDVHRDAYGSEAGKSDFVVINGRECAKLMFVVGTGEGATGSGFGEMPDFSSNYALAAAISDKLRETHAELARDIRVKTGRYNQHVSSQCLLVEVGHNMNTLEQALNAAEHLAHAIGSVAEAKEAAAAG